MLSAFLAKKMRAARYKILTDHTYFGEIPGLRGVWANTQNLETCREELRRVLEDWLLFRVRLGKKIPGFRVTLPALRRPIHAYKPELNLEIGTGFK